MLPFLFLMAAIRFSIEKMLRFFMEVNRDVIERYGQDGNSLFNVDKVKVYKLSLKTAYYQS